jgi:hypothetical protein
MSKRLWVLRFNTFEKPRYMGEAASVVDNLNDAVKFHSVAEMWTTTWSGSHRDVNPSHRDVNPVPIEHQPDVACWELVSDPDNYAISYEPDGTLYDTTAVPLFVHRRILTEPQWVEVDE